MIDADFSSLADRTIRRIERHIAAAEAASFLHPAQQVLLHRQGWLKMLAPRSTGGAELPLPQAVRLEEAVAGVDGSMAWVLTLCAGAGWFAGFLAPALAREIVEMPRFCIAGSGAATGYAEQEGDGYRISGNWDYASGAPMATHFTVNAILRLDGKPLLDALGAPRIRAFLVPAAQVQIAPSWRSIGMRASGTHSYRIDRQWVSKEHGFEISAEAATADGPLYRYPFFSLAYVTLAANMAGMAGHFLRLAVDCMGHRKHAASGVPLLEVPQVVALLQEKQQALAAARAHFYEVLDRSWDLVAAGAALGDDDVLLVRASSLSLVAIARAVVDELYPYCGLYAAREGSAINRVWRDFHTASQHSLLLP